MDGAPGTRKPTHAQKTRMDGAPELVVAAGLVFRWGLGVLGHEGGDAVGDGDASGSDHDLR